MNTVSVWNSAADWIKIQWDKINIEQWAKDLGDSSSDAVQVSICFVSGFAIGFLFKKYLKFVFSCIIVAFIAIKFLEYHAILDINWQALNTLLGFEPNVTFGSMVNIWLDWAKAHWLIVVSSLVGFLLGYKLG